MSSLTLLDPFPAWSPAAHRARYGDRDVVALLGPEVAGAAERSRARSASEIGRERPGALTLIDVVEHEGRAVWVYPGTEGITLGCVVDGELPPLRVAAELVAAVADRLVSMPEGLAHPGPAPADVVLTADSRVTLTGFVGPTLPDPGRRPPQGESTPEADMVYRLGVLLAELLTGSTPPSHSGQADHDATVRRVLIRIMSRPGPVFPERYRDWVQGMLAYDPDQRPVLSRVATSLRSLVADLPGPDLAVWAADEVPRRHHTALPASRSSVRTTDQLDVRDIPQRDMSTRETQRPGTDTLSGNEELPLDDVTAISTGSEPPPRPSRPEVGAIPVSVGPPVEVARMRPTLPPELFSEEDPTESRRPVSIPPEDTTPEGLPSGKTLAIVAAVLCLLSLALSAYLFG